MANKVPFLLFLTLLAGASFIRCTSGNRISVKNTGFESIHFGRSGGFTNIPDTYLLVNSGMVYKVANGEFTGLRKLDRPELREIAADLKELDIGSLDLSDRGNVTYFLNVKREDGEKQVTWTETSSHPGVKEFYQFLVSTLQSSKE